MKIQFTCYGCGESFNISIENLARKESLSCPNCERSFPQSNFESLRKIHAILLAAAEGLVVADEIGNIIQHWDFKFIY